jgi:hypothetical protein
VAGEGEGGAGGPLAKVAGFGAKFSGILLNWVAPIGAFIAGYGAGDVFGLSGLIDSFLPSAITTNEFVNIANLLTAGLYFVVGFMLARLVPLVGRILLGAFAGLAVNRLLASMKGPLAKLKPKNAPA